MLHYQTLEKQSFLLLQELMANPAINEAGFILAGGSALALQLGHRMSTDLDLFTNKPFNPQELKKALVEAFGDRISINSMNEIGFRGFIDGVKIDIVHFMYKNQHAPIIDNGIKLLNVDDISAMKVHAVANRGLRRDFVDLAEILQTQPLENILLNYMKQFNPSAMAYHHTMNALTYFGDAESTPQKMEILNGRKWEDVKKIVVTSVNKPTQKFTIPISKPPIAHNPHIEPSQQVARQKENVQQGQTLSNQTSKINEGTRQTTTNTETKSGQTPKLSGKEKVKPRLKVK